MQWNNRKNSFNDGKKNISEDNTLIATAITVEVANYICQLHNDKIRKTSNTPRQQQTTK